jgi:Uma2 family endonuclease
MVAEVKSPSDTWSELFIKVGEYLGAGVRVVVVVDPERVTVSTYRPGGEQEILREADTLTLPDVLPGFSVPVARLFA